MEVKRQAPGAPGTSSRAHEGLCLTGIYVYPVKSARGIAVSEARAVATGFEYDRRWMVVDEQGRFVTQRTEPRLVFVETAFAAGHLVLSAPGHGEVTVPLGVEPGVGAAVTVWSDTLYAREESAETASFFSDLLGAPHKLVRFPSTGERAVPSAGRRAGDADDQGSRDGLEPGEAGGASGRANRSGQSSQTSSPTGRRVQFADAYPFLLISQGSLDLLNEKLAARGEPAIGMERFRPNLVVAGCEPHAEDTWERLVIGDMRFDVAKPCARCVITTVNAKSATYGAEPLRTLATYRREAGKVLFGQNLIHHDEGVVALDAPCAAVPASSRGGASAA